MRMHVSNFFRGFASVASVVGLNSWPGLRCPPSSYCCDHFALDAAEEQAVGPTPIRMSRCENALTVLVVRCDRCLCLSGQLGGTCRHMHMPLDHGGCNTKLTYLPIQREYSNLLVILEGGMSTTK